MWDATVHFYTIRESENRWKDKIPQLSPRFRDLGCKSYELHSFHLVHQNDQ